MLCLFEFVSVAGNEQPSLIGGVVLRATSVADAKEMARSMLVSPAFCGQRPDVCLIKDATGVVLGKVWGSRSDKAGARRARSAGRGSSSPRRSVNVRALM